VRYFGPAITLILLTACACGSGESPVDASLDDIEATLDELQVKPRARLVPKVAEVGGFERLDASPPLPSFAGVSWPPQLGRRYPNLSLLGTQGNVVSLSDYEGKIILIELVGMQCGACNAFSGGNLVGAFPNSKVQGNLRSISEYVAQYGKGMRLDDPNIVFVQLIIFNMRNEAPALADIRAWSKHFRFEGSANHYVLAGTKDMISNVSFNMIPGFQLIDQNFILRSDSTGHHPVHDLYRHLIPLLRNLVLQRS